MTTERDKAIAEAVIEAVVRSVDSAHPWIFCGHMNDHLRNQARLIEIIRSIDLDAIIASVPGPWLLIEKAPKDGTWFLGWRKHAVKPVFVKWDVTYDAAENEYGEHVYHLTHWMPLPPQPKERGEALQALVDQAQAREDQ